jgi:hypothetical protein
VSGLPPVVYLFIVTEGVDVKKGIYVFVETAEVE